MEQDTFLHRIEAIHQIAQTKLTWIKLMQMDGIVSYQAHLVDFSWMYQKGKQTDLQQITLYI